MPQRVLPLLHCRNFSACRLLCDDRRAYNCGDSVINIRKHLGSLLARRDQWKEIAAGRMQAAAPASPASDHLAETVDFGPNPGALRMLTYLPPARTDHWPLLVVLHGCTQSAAGYDIGAGWSTL